MRGSTASGTMAATAVYQLAFGVCETRKTFTDHTFGRQDSHRVRGCGLRAPTVMLRSRCGYLATGNVLQHGRSADVYRQPTKVMPSLLYFEHKSLLEYSVPFKLYTTVRVPHLDCLTTSWA
eukprot:1774476-Pyramimonas_sp.AAC.1